MSERLRCHMFIGIPASGKSTLANELAPLINAEILSTDKIREELYKDETIQGNWNEIESLLHERLKKYIRQNKPVILDATFAMRPWRLTITQNLLFDKEIEWIGWWFKTPLEICLEWNQLRERKVDDPVIKRFAAALSNKIFSPDLSEGFATLINIDPSSTEDITKEIKSRLSNLDRNITQRKNKDSIKELHGYSKLLDFERLLYLMQLLIRFPDLSADDKKTKLEMEQICNPIPQGSIENKASKFLSTLHGSCYSDIEKLHDDLKWLDEQGFMNHKKATGKLEPPPEDKNFNRELGGLSRYSEKDAFIRVMSLIRYILHNPFDDKRIKDENNKKGISLHEHYISKLENIYFKEERDTLRKDIEKILTPYGFRDKNDNTRHGYGLGTAVLSRNRLEDIFQIIDQAKNKLNDPTISSVHTKLKERFKWAGFNLDNYPVRSFANKSVINPTFTKKDSLAVDTNTEELENAIKNGFLIEIEFFRSAGKFNEEEKEGSQSKLVWPIQLLFNNIGWYLAYEEKTFRDEPGLLKTERIDRIALRRIDNSKIRNRKDRDKALRKVQKLVEISGSIYFGETVEEQIAVLKSSEENFKKLLITVRFRTTEKIFRFLREELQRYPLNQMRLAKGSKKVFYENWEEPESGNFVLEMIKDDPYPYPVEIDLPSWTVKNDNDFRRWLLGFREGIIIESPTEFVEEIKSNISKLGEIYKTKKN